MGQNVFVNVYQRCYYRKWSYTFLTSIWPMRYLTKNFI